MRKPFSFFLTFLLLLTAGMSPARAVITNTAVWEVRTDGSDANGGGYDGTVSGAGTDYSRQGAAQKTWTNLISQGTNAPAQPTCSTATTGGSLVPKTYGVKITYVVDGGAETLPSNARSVIVPNGTSTNTITVTSPAPALGVTGYKVYLQSGGGFSSYWLEDTNETPIGTDFVITTAVTSGSNPPTTNKAQIKVKSSSPAFAATDVGNLLNITSGTNWIAQRYLILAYDSGTGYVTLDKLVSNTINNTSGHGQMGGALASLDEITVFQNPALEAGSTIWVRGGTYSIGTGAVPSFELTGGGDGLQANRLIGYSTTRGDGGSPTLSVIGGVSEPFTVPGNFWIVQNFFIEGNNDPDITPAGLEVSGDLNILDNVTVVDCPICCSVLGYGNKLRRCEFSLSNLGAGLTLSNTFGHVQSTLVEYCTMASNQQDGVLVGNGLNTVRFCTIYSNTRNGVFADALKYGAAVQNCVIWGNGGSGVLLNSVNTSVGGGAGLSLENNIIANNTRYCLESVPTFGLASPVTWAAIANFGNAYYVGSGLGISDGDFPLETGSYISLSADPFVNSGTADFRLNATAGGGAAITGSSLRNVLFLNNANNTTHTTTGITE